MIGTGSLGQLALGQEATAQLVYPSARGSMRVLALAPVHAGAPVAALGRTAVVDGRLSWTLQVPLRGAAVLHGLVPFGISIPIRAGVVTEGHVLPNGFVQAKLRARMSSYSAVEFRLTGAGKRRDFPSYIAQAPYDAKPAKPFRPIWDRKNETKAGEPVAKTENLAPTPLPPLMGARRAGVDTAALPNFSALVPQDPSGLARRMSEAQDVSDAIAVLRAIGLLPQNEDA